MSLNAYTGPSCTSESRRTIRAGRRKAALFFPGDVRRPPDPRRQGRIESTYPPSTRSAPPVVAEAWSELR